MTEIAPGPRRPGWLAPLRQAVFGSLPGRLFLLAGGALLAGWLVVQLVFPGNIVAEPGVIALCSPGRERAVATDCQRNAVSCQIAVERLLRQHGKVSSEDSVRSVLPQATPAGPWTATVARRNGDRTVFTFGPCQADRAKGKNY